MSAVQDLTGELQDAHAQIARLLAVNAELVAVMREYVSEYEVGEKAIEAIIGRRPETGIHLDRMRAAIERAGRDHD